MSSTHEYDNCSIINESIFIKYYNALTDGDKRTCHKVVQYLLESNTSIEDIFIKLIHRSLYRVGLEWQQNKISVATEHLATAITEEVLVILYPIIFETNRIGKKIIVACTPGEQHQLGAKIISNIVELAGFDSYFIGSNTPTDDLVKIISKYSPDALCLSLTLYSNLSAMISAVENIVERYPNLTIIVGGRGLIDCKDKPFSIFSNILYIETIDKFKDYLDELKLN